MELPFAQDQQVVQAFLVGDHIRHVARTLLLEALDEVVDPAHLHRVLFDEGVLRPEAAWVEDIMQVWTKARVLSYFALVHNAGRMYDKRTW